MISCLNEEQEVLLLKGLEEFNAGHYFECHETLETLWKGLSGDEKTLVQGIIQVSVAYYHWHRGNLKGALRLFDRAIPRIEPYLPTSLGFDLVAFLAAVQAERSRLLRCDAIVPPDLPAPNAPFICRLPSG